MTLVQTAAPSPPAPTHPRLSSTLPAMPHRIGNRRDIRYDVAPGPDLVPQGEAEAARLGEFLRDAGVTRIVASLLVRTHRTAEIAGAIAGARATVDEAVREYAREENDDIVFARFFPLLETIFSDAGRRRGCSPL